MAQKIKNSFFEDVHEVAKLIPCGKVTSYGAIANYLGINKSARMVGFAMNAAHGNPEIPAHRVVNRVGLLSGKNHFSYPDEMKDKLESEGITIDNDQIVNFTQYFWDPAKEIGF